MSSTIMLDFNIELNNIIEFNSRYYNSTTFNTIESTKTSSLKDTILVYNKDFNILFCTLCSINLDNINYLKHIKKQHNNLYITYKKDSVLEDLESLVSRLGINTNNLTSITYNKYYFTELPLILKGYKCRECLFINVNRKSIRQHYNIEHTTNPTRNINFQAEYIINNVPLQVLEGFKYNRKLYFIPKLPIFKEPLVNPLENRLISLKSNKSKASTTSLLSIESNSTSSNSNSIDNNSNSDSNSSSTTKKEILNYYINTLEERSRNVDYNNPITSNKRLLNSFIKNSNILNYLKDKNTTVLGELIENKDNSTLELDLEYDYDILETLVFNLFEEVHSIIPNITRRLRQLVKTENPSKELKEMSDFIPLESFDTKKQYFKVYTRLVTYIIRVYLIKTFYSNTLEETKQEYFNTVKDISLTKQTRSIIKDLLKYDFKNISYNYNPKDVEDFNLKIVTLFNSLLDDTIYISFNTNNTLNNIVISYYFNSILDSNTKELKNINYISRLSSIFIYNTRLIFLGYYYLYEKSTKLDPKTLNNLIENNIKISLSNSSKNYFEELTQIRAYSIALNRNFKSENYLIKEVKEDVINFNNIDYPISKLKDFFINILYKLELSLKEDLLFINSLDLLKIPFSNIEDTPLLNRVNNYIIDIFVLKDFNTYFLKELLDKRTKYYKNFVKTFKNNKIIFKRAKIEKFLKDLNNFIELLALGIYLTSGGPLRGTELTTLLYKNIEVKNRSLIYSKEEQLFILTTDYYKTQNITRKENINVRLLPPRLSKIVLIYLITIIPFRDYIYKEYYNNLTYNNPYLLFRNNTYLPSNIISNRLKKETSLYFREGLTIKSYRKIINYIIKTKFNAYDYNSSSSSDPNLIEDKQANRSTKVSFNYYFNIDSYFTSKNTLEIKELREFSFRYFTYFNLITLSNDNLSLFKRELGSTSNIRPITLNLYTKEEILINLRRLYNNATYSFKNLEQKEAVTSILNNNPIITYINKTSSGKSLIYLLPSYINKQALYIIITPRISLTTDLYNKAKDLKLNPSLITNNPTLNSNLYFITLESLNTRELDVLINKYKDYSYNITIFIDEVHLFLLEESFRLNLRYFNTILKYEVNLVFISATLPSPLLNILNTTLNIKEYNLIIRGLSNRSNISYKRLYYKEQGEDLKILGNILTSINSTDLDLSNKVLIFVNSIALGQKLSSTLNISFIYASLENSSLVLEEFLKNSSKRVLITTSILEVGLDLREIKYTISIEPIFSLLSIIQSSGRIRNSGTSYIISRNPLKYTLNNIKNNPILTKTITTIEDFILLDKAYYTLFTIENKCLRSPLSFFLDNTYYKCSNNDALCSLCLETNTILTLLKEDEESKTKENNTRTLDLKIKLIDYYNNYCLYCLIDLSNLNNNFKHSIRECLKINKDEEYLNIHNTIKSQIRSNSLLKKQSACPNCLLPKNLCLELKNEYNLNDNCYLKDYLYNFISILYYFKDIIEASLGIPKILSLNSFITAMLDPTTLYNLKTIKLIKIFSTLNIISLIDKLDALGSKTSSSSEESSSNISSNRSSRTNSRRKPFNTYFPFKSTKGKAPIRPTLDREVSSDLEDFLKIPSPPILSSSPNKGSPSKTSSTGLNKRVRNISLDLSTNPKDKGLLKRLKEDYNSR